MKVLVAPDKFAGTMTALQAGRSISRGWLSERRNDLVRVVPMADGGPGTIECIATATGSKVRFLPTHDQTGRSVEAPWLALSSDTVVVEAASACGLDLVPEALRRPLRHNTHGVGTLLAAVIEKGFRKVVVGLGGSGTVDGGVGAAMAMGAGVFGETGRLSHPIAPEDYDRITDVTPTSTLSASIIAASDVANPLLGSKGAAMVFGPQKGASPDEVNVLESSLRQLAQVVEDCLEGGPWRDIPGAGAAGGLGFGLMAWAGATVVPGARMIGDLIRLAEHIVWADFVITGEGSLDTQSLEGKAPFEVLRLAKEASKPAAAVAGTVAPELEALFEHVEILGQPGLSDPVGESMRAGARLARQFRVPR